MVALGAGVYKLIAPESPPARQASTRSPAKPTTSKDVHTRPVRLVVPKIGLDAVVEHVGLTEDYLMASPSSPGTVGWYKLGPCPGNRGNAVIDGHSGYADGTTGAFDDLSELGKGDRLYVTDTRGNVASFLVRKKTLYARDADATEVFGKTRNIRLNLITCTGSYDVAAGTHSQRLVLFCDREVQ